MQVQIVDPPAYTPPYDRSLSAALAAAGADVELVTSEFPHGPVPPAEGYEVITEFYRRSSTASARLRRPLRAAEHLADMRRFRARRPVPDVTHFQWLTAPGLDARLLPRGRPLVQTPHGLLRAPPWEGRARGYRRLLGRMDALVALSEYGAGVLRERAGVPADRVHVIPHGPLDYLTRLPREAPLPGELTGVEGPVVLFFGLIRPYKGVDVLLEAFREVRGAELWIVGRPFGVEMSELHALADRCEGTVRFVSRFVEDAEVPALFRRADLVALPHRDAEQSGVLFTALAFAKAIVMSDAGGFGEVAALGAGRAVPAGDAAALGGALTELLGDPAARGALAAAARDAATGPYSWERVAAAHLALCRRLAGR
ncbi:MAG: glycosyltransferase family 4 protein, partial [Solirubrobacterales bacterium]